MCHWLGQCLTIVELTRTATSVDYLAERFRDSLSSEVESLAQPVAHKARFKGSGAYIDESAEGGKDAWMPQTKRVVPGGMVFHALSRGVGENEDFLEGPRLLGL